MRLVWILIGALSLLFGLIGIVLPFLPTTPFLLVSAFCFAQSSERFHSWLINHPVLGPPIADWQEHGAISWKAKIYATLSIIASFLLTLWLAVPLYAIALQGVVLICVLIFIWSRPDNVH